MAENVIIDTKLMRRGVISLFLTPRVAFYVHCKDLTPLYIQESHGKGYATEAISLITDHAFNKLNLHKLYTGMVKGNEASKRAFESVGFKVEGILREHFYLNDEHLDCYRMGLLKSEYKK